MFVEVVMDGFKRLAWYLVPSLLVVWCDVAWRAMCCCNSYYRLTCRT